MPNRKRIPAKQAKKSFKRNANSIHPKNKTSGRPKRGGIRL